MCILYSPLGRSYLKALITEPMVSTPGLYQLSYPERCLKEIQHHLYVFKCFIVVCV